MTRRQEAPTVDESILAPPVRTHTVTVRGFIRRAVAAGVSGDFTLGYTNLDVPAAIAAAKRDALRIYALPSEPAFDITIEHVYVSN